MSAGLWLQLPCFEHPAPSSLCQLRAGAAPARNSRGSRVPGDKETWVKGLQPRQRLGTAWLPPRLLLSGHSVLSRCSVEAANPTLSPCLHRPGKAAGRLAMGRACSLRVATGGGKGLGVCGRVWDTAEPSAGGRSPHPAGAPRWGGSAGAPGHCLSLDVTSSNSSRSQRWGEGKRDPPGGPEHPQAGNALLQGLCSGTCARTGVAARRGRSCALRSGGLSLS